MDTRKDSCWQSSKAEKTLLGLLIVISFVSLGLLIGLIMKSKTEPDKTHHDTCDSRECIDAASTFLKNMDQSIDPCTDFYKYACGSFGNRTDLAESTTNAFDERQKETKKLTQKIIEQPWTNSQPMYYKKIKDYYSSCMDVSSIEKLGASPLLAKLNQVGGWPVLVGSDWNENAFSIENTFLQFRNWGFGFKQFFNLVVVTDLQNSTLQILKLGKPLTTLPSLNYYKQEKYREGYLKHMIAVAVLLGAEKTRAESDMKDVFQFESAIAELREQSDEQNKKKEASESVVPVGKLQNIIPQINWIVFLNRLKFPKLITEHERVVVSHMLKNVSTLFENSNKRIISNYLLWTAILESYYFLDDAFLNLYKKFESEVKANKVDIADREKFCTTLTIRDLQAGCGAMFIKNKFVSDAKSLVSEIVSNIKVVLRNGISNAEWLDSETMKKAKEKLEAITDYIAYPDEVLDDSIMNDLYKSVSISKKDFLNNGLQVMKFSIDFNFASIIETNVELSWEGFADNILQVNAAYFHGRNSIMIFAGILGSALFNQNRPRYLNYGGIGTIIGHEFIHGFDTTGKQFDLHGNLKNWWTNETDRKFREKADEVVRLYSSFNVPELNLSVGGERVQGEAISDIEGFQLSYKAYKKWEEENEEEVGLPGIPLNSRQLFWLQLANLWCTHLTEEQTRWTLQIGAHPPGEFRVRGAFTNSKYFSKDFNCPVGSPMNPEQKISFW